MAGSRADGLGQAGRVPGAVDDDAAAGLEQFTSLSV